MINIVVNGTRPTAAIRVNGTDYYSHNWKLYNNTIIADVTYYPYWGVVVPSDSLSEKMYINNNIIMNFGSGCIRAADATGIDSLWITNNVQYNNGSSNDPTWGTGAPTHYTYADSIKSDPLFMGGGDYHLQSSSPAKYAGTNVGLSTDYAGNAWQNPPSIGALEFVSSSTTTATKIAKHNGHYIKQNGHFVKH